jgi:hypothetical protein
MKYGKIMKKMSLILAVCVWTGTVLAETDYERKARLDGGASRSTKGASTTLTTGSGEGDLSVTVTPYGTFGHSSSGGTASFDPIGPKPRGDSVYESAVYFSPIGGFFHSGDIDGPALPDTVDFTSTSSTRAVSEFDVSGFHVELTQEVTSIENGSSLIQKYRIINNTGSQQSFYLMRHVDGDLLFDDTLQDMGGARENGNLLYEFDSGDNPDEPTTFFGIRSQGGNSIGYRIASYPFKDDLVAEGRAVLNNNVDGDGNGDGLTDSPYDVTLTQGREFTIAPGSAANFHTTTIWGEGAPVADIEWDEERCEELYGESTPIRVVQVVDVDNEKLVAGKPAVVRAYIRMPDESATARQVTGKLYVDDAFVEEVSGMSFPKDYFSDRDSDPSFWDSFLDFFGIRKTKARMIRDGDDTLVFGLGQDLTFDADVHSVRVDVLDEQDNVLLSRLINVTFRDQSQRVMLVRVPVHLQGQDGEEDEAPDREPVERATSFLSSIYPVSDLELEDATIPVILEQKISDIDSEGLSSGDPGWSLTPQGRATRKLLDDLEDKARYAVGHDDWDQMVSDGVFVAVVGLAPDVRGIFYRDSVYGYTWGGRATVQRVDDRVDMTVAHEVGHMAPIYLDDTYGYSGSSAHRDEEEMVGSRAPGHVGAFNPANFNDSSIEGNNHGNYITYEMGAYNLTYTHPTRNIYRRGPLFNSQQGALYGFMGGAALNKFAEINEYDRLCDIFIPSSTRGTKGGRSTKSGGSLLPVGDIAVVRGVIGQDDSVAFLPVRYTETTAGMWRPDSGTHRLVALGAGDVELDSTWFSIAFEIHANGDWEELGSAPFSVPISYSPAVRSFKILDLAGVELARLIPSASAPQVNIQQQAVAAGEMVLSWTASDADNDELVYSLLFSNDGGVTSSILMSGLTNTQMTVSLENLPGSDNAVLTVLASDGYLTGEDQTNPFSIAEHDPEPVIIGLRDGGQVPVGQPVRITGRAFDLDEGMLDNQSLVWKVNDVQEGTGGVMYYTFATVGAYELSLSITDSDGNPGVETITVYAYDEDQTPVADAGADQSRGANTLVVLDGSLSTDPNLDDLQYAWTQIAGPAVQLNGADTVTPTFTMPTLAEDEFLEFELIVSDGANSSVPDTVVVREGAAGVVDDVTDDMDSEQQNWRLNPNTGSLNVDFQLTYNPAQPDKPDLTDAFWVVLPDSANWRLADVSGLTADGRPYFDVTASVEQQLLATYGRTNMQPGDSVTVTVSIFSRDRSIPAIGGVYAIWADPPITEAFKHRFDGNADGVIDDFEILEAVDGWNGGTVDDFGLLEAIELWRAGGYEWDETQGKFVPKN